ncbi:MAG: BamA/TamA family outer membrane protein [Lacunisphaera sp.]
MRDHFQDSPAWRRPWTVCSSASAGRAGLFLVLLFAGGARAGEEVTNPEGAQNATETAIAAQPVPGKKAGNGNEWVVAPIPTLDPSQGLGLQTVAQYIFKSAGQAADTPSSIVAVGGFYTEEKSWGVFGGYLGHWQDDQWRPAIGGGYGNVHYDFYGVGNQLAKYDQPVPVDQTATFGMVQLMRRFLPGFYAGLRLAVSETDVSSVGINQPPVVLPPFDLSVTTVSGALVAQWDTRNNQFFPTQGHYANLSASFHNGDDHFQSYKFEWNCYHALGDRAVLAGRVFLHATAGDAPFYALSSFGQSNDLRGYKSGKYRDRDMFATQVEYRCKLSERWGAVVFAGVGEVARNFGDMNYGDLLPSAGARPALPCREKPSGQPAPRLGLRGRELFLPRVGEAF